MPKVSIILTSYNHEKYIRAAIESVLAQSFGDYELIIVDDCSSDNSWEIIQAYDDPRIVAIRNDTNRRMAIYYNLYRCSGEYVAVHHSDDVWEPTKLQKQVEFLEEHPEIAACFTRAQFIDEDGALFYPPKGSSFFGCFDPPNRERLEWLRYFYEVGNGLCHPSVLIRKDMYEKYKLFTYGLAQFPDFMMWIRLCLYEDIYILSEKLTLFRVHGSNTSGDRLDTRIRLSIEYTFILDEFLRITDLDDFLVVFPSANQYLTSKGMVIPFALARTLLEHTLPQARYLGLRMLYHELNDPTSAAHIKDLYGYTYKDYIGDTGKYDVFNITKALLTLNSSLFVDTGNGFNEHERIGLQVYVTANGSFHAAFNLEEIAANKTIKGLRYDPDEGRYLSLCLDKVEIDGQNANVQSNALLKTNGFDLFLTIDPIFILNHNTTPYHNVDISGFVRLPIEAEFEWVTQEQMRIREENHMLAEELTVVQSAHEVLQVEHGRLQSAHEVLQVEHGRLQSAHEVLQVEHGRLQSEREILSGNLAATNNRLYYLNGQKDALQETLTNIRNSRTLRFFSRFTKLRDIFYDDK